MNLSEKRFQRRSRELTPTKVPELHTSIYNGCSLFQHISVQPGENFEQSANELLSIWPI